MVIRMKMVELMSPPTAERAKEAQIWRRPASTWINTKGSIPRTVVPVVMKIGRILSLAPWITASRRGRPFRRFILMWSTSKIELLTTIPPSKITPIYAEESKAKSASTKAEQAEVSFVEGEYEPIKAYLKEMDRSLPLV